MDRILVEYIAICRSWIGEEQLVVDAIGRSPWKDRVEIRTYMQETDPQITGKYGGFEESTVIINEKVKVSRVSPDRVLRAIEKEIARLKWSGFVLVAS